MENIEINKYINIHHLMFLNVFIKLQCAFTSLLKTSERFGLFYSQKSISQIEIFKNSPWQRISSKLLVSALNDF